MRRRGAAMVEYGLFVMAMVVGTAAAKKLCAERASGIADFATELLDEAAGSAARRGGGEDDNAGGAKTPAGESGDEGATSGAAGSDRAKRQGKPERSKVSLNDDGLSPP